MLVAGPTAAARHWHDFSGGAVSSSYIWLWLTLSAKRATLPPAASWWIIISKKCPEKVIPLNKTPPSIHQRRSLPDIGLWEHIVLRPKPGRKCWALNSFFPKPIDIRSTLYHDKGNRIVNGVCLILLNRWQSLVNAYVHNYASVLSTVWLNRSNNILVRCLVLSSV